MRDAIVRVGGKPRSVPGLIIAGSHILFTKTVRLAAR